MFSIATADIRCGSVQLVSRGIWTAEIEPIEGVTLTTGQRVDLTLGALALSGTIIDGGFFVAGNGFFVVGGAGGWRGDVERRSYRDEKGLRLVDVARDLATATGETVEVDSSLSSAVLGPAWTRPAGTGAAALDDLRHPWRVLPSGVTTIGPLATVETSALLSLRKYHPALGVAEIEFPDDELDGVVPGTSLDFGEVALVVQRVRIVIATGGKVWAEAKGS